MLRLSLLGLLLLPLAVLAEPTPTGNWQLYDEENHSPEAVVQLEADGSTLNGRITQLFTTPGEDPAPRCERCEGTLKNSPIIGLMILNHLKPDDKRQLHGELLDPETGKTYRCRLAMINAKEMQLRIFSSIFWQDRRMLRID